MWAEAKDPHMLRDHEAVVLIDHSGSDGPRVETLIHAFKDVTMHAEAEAVKCVKLLLN